ncbi:MAG TPA: ShlB/FhaC/HecB family hemolysin secretion/activation protein [Stellaceae bacterium]|nr:ShlB/FhaC/HecB family hemolysin secretion/activation protein [Stellaceae bacterium]
MATSTRVAMVIGVLIAFTLPPAALAQNYPLVEPKELPAAPPPALTVPPPPEPAMSAAQQNQVIVAKLAGLHLIDSAAKFVPGGIRAAGVTFDGPPLLDVAEIRTALAAFLGKPLTFGGLSDITRVIIGYYRTQGRPFVDVVFPEQDVSSGIVQAVVTEFRVGQIKFEHNDWFSTDLLRREVNLAPGDPIETRRLQADLDRLNENPFRTVAAVAEKSDTPGDTDLVFNVQDRLPLRVYGGYDNTGTPVLGHDRWNLGFNWGNALWLDQQLAYQLTTGNDFWHHRAEISGQSNDPTFVAHSVSYTIPVFAADRILLFGTYEKAIPRLGPDLGVIGVSEQASIRYARKLPTLGPLTHEIQVGYDFKSSNNNLEFGGQTVSNVTSEVDQFPLVYSATIKDPLGETSLQNQTFFSPGNLSGENKDAVFEAQANNPFAKARYVYDNLTLTRVTKLPYNASWVMRVTGQTSDHNLLPSEQLGAGGFDSVRGYDERAANGSLGLLLREELRSPPFSLLRGLPHTEGDQAQLLTFWDYGAVRDKQVAPGTQVSTEITSIGLGLRYSVPRYFDMRLDYGWQLRHLPGQPELSQMAQLAVTVSY